MNATKYYTTARKNLAKAEAALAAATTTEATLKAMNEITRWTRLAKKWAVEV